MIFRFDEFELVSDRRILLHAGVRVQLSGKAFDILHVLVGNAGIVVSYKELMGSVWPDTVVEQSNLRVHLSNLRRELGDGVGGRRYIENIIGRGYCFVGEVTSERNHGPERLQSASVPAALATNRPEIFGRKAESEELCVLLPRKHLVSIVGPGGVGKTTLAVHVAAMVCKEAGFSPYFVDLSVLDQGTQIIPAIANAVGIHRTFQIEDALLETLASEPSILLLDNCEHIIEQVGPVCTFLLQQCTCLTILATSREPLRTMDEQVFALSPLETPGEADVADDVILSYPSVQLYMERAQSGGYTRPFCGEDLSVVAELCRRLDGLPLAIELVAGRSAGFGLHGSLQLLDEKGVAVWKGRRDGPSRHLTIDTMLNWSFENLSAFDQHVLCKLAYFRGPFTLEDCCAIAPVDGIASAIASLLDKSIVMAVASPTQPAFRLLETTRAFAFGKLQVSSELAETARLHATHWLKRLRASPPFDALLETDPARRFSTHLSDLRAALEWADNQKREAPDFFVELCARACQAFLASSYLKECQEWCYQAVEMLPVAKVEEDIELLLQRSLTISTMFANGNKTNVRKSIKRGLDLAAQIGSSTYQLELLAALNIYLIRVGDLEKAIETANEFRRVADDAQNPVAVAISDMMAGVSIHLTGDQVEAQKLLERGVKYWPEGGRGGDMRYGGYDHRIRAMIALTRCYWLRGCPEKSAAMANLALAEAEQLGDPITLSFTYIYTCTEALWRYDEAAAENLIERLEIEAERNSLLPYRIVGDCLRGELNIRRGNVSDGIGLLRKALTFMQKEEHHVLRGAFLGSLARGWLKIGDFKSARATLDEAHTYQTHKLGSVDQPELLMIEGELASADHPGRDLERARRSLETALARAREQGALHQELRAMTAMVCAGFKPPCELAALLELFAEGRETIHIRNAVTLLNGLMAEGSA